MKKLISILLAIVVLSLAVGCNLVEYVNLTTYDLQLGPGQTYKIKFSLVEPADANLNNIRYSSDDTSIATVGKDGVITAVSTGTTKIRVKTSKSTDTMTVRVVTSGRTSHGNNSTGYKYCDFVQLWYGGPFFAEVNLGSTLENGYTNATSYDVSVVGGNYPDHYDSGVKQMWGDDWRLPKGGELTSFSYYCDITYCDGITKQYETGCTLKGFEVKGKGDYSTNRIFLPIMSSAYDTVYYWQDSSDGGYAYVLGANGNHGGAWILSSNNCPIRPIYEEK